MASNFPSGLTPVDPKDIPEDILPQVKHPSIPEGLIPVDPKDLPEGLVLLTSKGVVPATQENQQVYTHGEPGTALSQGVVQGALRDPGLALARGVGVLGEAVPPVATDAAAAWEQSLRAARADYEAKYGSSAMAGAGRVLGSMVPTAAVGGVANALLRPLPLVGNMLTAGSTGGPFERLASTVGQGAVQGAIGGAVSSGQSDEPLLNQVERGAAFGGAVNPLTSAAAGVRGGLMIDPETARLAQSAVAKGMPLRAAQLSNSQAVRYLDSALRYTPFSGYGSNTAEFQTAFNRALNMSFGEDADKLTSGVLQRAASRMGAGFDRIGAQASADISDPAALGRLADIETRARLNLTDQEYAIVQRHIDDVVNKAASTGGVIPGDAYLSLVKKGAPLYDMIDSTNPNIERAGMGIKDVLDSAAQKSLTPDQAAEFQDLRRQYKNFITARPLAVRSDTVGGATPSVGDVSPEALRARVNQVYGADNAAMGYAGEIGELAQIGQRFKEARSPGTAEKYTAMNLLGKAASLGGLAAGGHFGLEYLPPEYGVPAGIAAAAAVPGIRGIGNVMQSPALRDSIISSSLGGRAGPISNMLDLSYRYGAPTAGILANELTRRPDTPQSPGVPIR